jgi:hypothetical protein
MSLSRYSCLITRAGALVVAGVLFAMGMMR